jgi:hypothetical protein
MDDVQACVRSPLANSEIARYLLNHKLPSAPERVPRRQVAGRMAGVAGNLPGGQTK